MKGYHTIKVNCKGGIISPGELLEILNVASQSAVKQVGFGLRQQLLIDVEENLAGKLSDGLLQLGVAYEVDKDDYPNIVSSYPAEEVFINNSWLSEGVYKDILDELDHRPRLKINVSDSNQSFTPLLTGNINWVASPRAPHFWHLFIRFPKTNRVFEWNEMVYTNDIARLSRDIEHIIFDDAAAFVHNQAAEGETLFQLIKNGNYITRFSEGSMKLPSFNLPYYEGFNRHNNKYWLGVYRRNEMFPVAFLKELCQLCLHTKLGQLCSTPWKSIIIKGIEEKDKHRWSHLLDKHEINMRHAANELNFQVEDNDEAARKLKSQLVRKLNVMDARTFGICIGIKTRKGSEIFSSILIRRKPLLKVLGKSFFHVYDILCSKDFNPNERTESVFVSNVPRWHLITELLSAVLWYYKNKTGLEAAASEPLQVNTKLKTDLGTSLFQCSRCLGVYDQEYGDPDQGIDAGTVFRKLPDHYCCPTCEAPKKDFKRISCSEELVNSG
jgi:rubredoxin